MTTPEGEEKFEIDTGRIILSQEQDDEIDRLNKKSYWYVYVAVGVWYLAMGIWYGCTISNATEQGAVTNAYP